MTESEKIDRLNKMLVKNPDGTLSPMPRDGIAEAKRRLKNEPHLSVDGLVCICMSYSANQEVRV